MRAWGRKLILAALAVSGLALVVRAAGPVLPGDGFFPGWRISGKARTFIKSDLFNHIDGGAELFLEFGFGQAVVQRYAKDEAEIVLEAYEMAGPEAALGIYLMKCGTETPLPGIPARNSSEPAQFTILKGRYFVQIDNPEGDAALVPAMTALAAAFLASIPEQAVPPGVLALLPKERRIAGSERLIRGPFGLQPYFTFGEGDILGLGGRIFAALANYVEPQGQASNRMVVPYAGEADAGTVFLGLKANLDPYLKIVAAGKKSFVFVDFRERYGRVAWTGARLDLAFNLPVRPAL